ncbi:MAG: hypothetical protein MI867_14315, partial [Pseudomonadales bacterium]|nr:hypothetical protein [Pseudomonadales bacterium]
MSHQGSLEARPPRITFASLRTGESVEMPFTPEQFQEDITVEYVRQNVLGLSHQPLQYRGTSNHVIPDLEFFFRATSREEIERIHNGRRFLLSLCYPPDNANTIRRGGPTRVLFVWPQVVTMTFVITRLSITHEKFNQEGRTTVFRAKLTIEEIRDARLTADEVRERGTIRA